MIHEYPVRSSMSEAMRDLHRDGANIIRAVWRWSDKRNHQGNYVIQFTLPIA